MRQQFQILHIFVRSQYQARLFVIAMMQQIVYKEELPALLGEHVISITPQLQMSEDMARVSKTNSGHFLKRKKQGYTFLVHFF